MNINKLTLLFFLSCIYCQFYKVDVTLEYNQLDYNYHSKKNILEDLDDKIKEVYHGIISNETLLLSASKIDNYNRCQLKYKYSSLDLIPYFKYNSVFVLGKEGSDANTRIDIECGQFENVGNVHFSDEKHLCELFSSFDIISLEEKIINTYEPKNNHQFSSWNIVAKKK